MKERLKSLLKGLCLGGGLAVFALTGPALAGPVSQPMDDNYTVSQSVDCVGDCQQDRTMDRQMDDNCTMDQDMDCVGDCQQDRTTDRQMQSICDPFHLSLCADQDSCEGAGGHWYEDQCHRYAPDQVEECVSQAMARHYRAGEPLMDPAQERHQIRAEKAIVGCDLMVPPEDQGQEAMLAMYAFCPDHPEWGWIDLSGMLNQHRVRLGEQVKINLDVDLSNLAGMRFNVCCGYFTDDGQIGYHCFQVEITE